MKHVLRRTRNTLGRGLATQRRLLTRTDLLNHLATVHGYTSYLEIGVRDPTTNFDRVRAEVKHGVDPQPRGRVAYQMTSDEFFGSYASRCYDLIFIDGLHLAQQAERDITNALQRLTREGTIVLHDCNPQTEDAQVDTYDGHSLWNGSVWKAWAKFRATRTDLDMQVVDMDHGCGVIRYGHQELYPLFECDYERIDYATLEADRKSLLNLVDPAVYVRASLARRWALPKAAR